MEAVKPSDFYSPTNQTIFEAMKDLFDSGRPIDSVTVSETVFKDKKIQQAWKLHQLQDLLRMFQVLQTLKDILRLSLNIQTEENSWKLVEE